MKCDEADLTGFLNSELNTVQTTGVAEHLETCADCQDRLQLLLEMRQNRAELQRLRVRSRRRTPFWLAAAAVVLLVLVGIWIGFKPPTANQLAVATPYPLVPPELRTSRVNRVFLEAAEAYSRGEWPLAEQKFQRYLAQDPQHYDAAFFLANVEYMLGKYSESERMLMQLADRNNTDNRVQWYLANSRLKRGDVAGARTVLETLAGRTGEYSNDAKALLRRLSP